MSLKLLSIMQNKFILLCAATVALAACAKTEVTPEVLNQDAEITFLTAPVTKTAAENEKTFANTNVFQTAAFYDVNAFAYSSSTAETYIAPSTVKYFTSVWKVADAQGNAKSYYWPKDGGKLSFFSWSLNTGSLAFAQGTPTVDINKTDGVKLTGYSSLKNDDFMVADAALDMTQNDKTPKYYTEGVPTLFHHRTAKVEIKVMTKENYEDATKFGTFMQDFKLNEIKFANLLTNGDYTQASGAWSNTAETASASYYVNNATNCQDITATATTVDTANSTDGSVCLYLPQDFTSTDKTLEVKYTVTRLKDASTTGSSKEYTKSIKMSEILGTGVSFEMGKKYVITLIFGLDEILWDPAVYEWEVGVEKEYSIK